MGKIRVVSSQKGGVGKTTTSFHFVHGASETLAELGPTEQALAIDFCGQGNLSQFLTGNLDIQKQPGGAEMVFTGGDLPYTDTMLPNVKLLFGHGDLGLLDIDDTILERALELRDFVRELPFAHIIIDTPPALGPRIAAPMLWAHEAYIVVEAHMSSVTGLDDTFRTIEVAQELNPDLDVKLVLNRFMKSSSSAKKFQAVLEERFGSDLVEKFALRTGVADACQNFLPVWKFAKDKELKQQWRNFATQAFA